jgi:hypothetical protein
MMRLRRGEVRGQAVDRRRGGGDDLADPGIGTRLEDVERPVHQDIFGQPRLLGALRDADRRLMEDTVHVTDVVGDDGPIANVADGNGEAARRVCLREILLAAANEVVEDNDLVRTTGEKLVDDRGTDRAGAPGDEEPGPFNSNAAH